MIMTGLIAAHREKRTVLIDATDLKALRAATSVA